MTEIKREGGKIGGSRTNMSNITLMYKNQNVFLCNASPLFVCMSLSLSSISLSLGFSSPVSFLPERSAGQIESGRGKP